MPGLQVLAEAGSSGKGRVSRVRRLAWAHLGLHGGPFLVADPFLKAGQERRLGWPHVRNLVPLAHGCPGERDRFPRAARECALVMAPTRDVTQLPPPGRRPGNMAASLLASPSDPSAKFKSAAILSVRNPDAPRGWRCGYPLPWSRDRGVRAPWRPAAKVSKEFRLHEPRLRPQIQLGRTATPAARRVPGWA